MYYHYHQLPIQETLLIKDHITFKTTMPEDICLGLHCFLPRMKDPLFKDLHLCEPQGGLSRGGLLYGVLQNP